MDTSPYTVVPLLAWGGQKQVSANNHGVTPVTHPPPTMNYTFGGSLRLSLQDPNPLHTAQPVGATNVATKTRSHLQTLLIVFASGALIQGSAVVSECFYPCAPE